jgi:hypothetical protein
MTAREKDHCLPPVAVLSGFGTGPVTCPACGETFTGRWSSPDASSPQECPNGHVVTVSWPGWEAAAPSS